MTTYYVRPLGNKNNDGLTFQTAKADLTDLKLKPGDEVHAYNDDYDPFKAYVARVTWYSHNAGIDGSDSSAKTGILVLADYNTFFGWRVHDVNGTGVAFAAGTHHGTFAQGISENNAGHGISSSADSMKILDNIVRNNVAVKADNYPYISGISVYAPEEAGPNDMAYGYVIRGNIVTGTHNDVRSDASGILIDTTGGYSEMILVQDNEASGNGGAGFLAYKAAHVLVAGGYYHHNATDPLKGLPPEVGVNYSHDITIRNVTADAGSNDDFVYKQGGGSYDVHLINDNFRGRILIPDAAPAAKMSVAPLDLDFDFYDAHHVGVQSNELHW